MDIRLPELDGLQATRRILADDQATRVLILTTFDLDEYVYEALGRTQVSSCAKDDPPEQLLAAIRIVADGEALLSPAITKRVIEKSTRISHPDPPRELADLIDRELDVLRLIARRRSNAEIGEELYISDATRARVAESFGERAPARSRRRCLVESPLAICSRGGVPVARRAAVPVETQRRGVVA